MVLSNQEIEDVAIQTVLAREGGRDVRKLKRGYDVESLNGPIEVKGIKKSLKEEGGWRWVQPRTVQLLMKNENFRIFIVDNIGKDSSHMGIYELKRNDALKCLDLKPAISYSIKIPAAELKNLKVK